MSGPRKLKKSEFLEVRLPYPTKQAFMERCRTDGASASETVRRFIEGYLTGEARPQRRKVGGPKLIAAGAALLAFGAVAAPSLAHPGLQQQFAELDANGDGRVSPTEFSRGVELSADISAARGGHGLLGLGRSRLSLDGGTRRSILAQEFARLDGDHDGELSAAEFRRGYGR